MVTNKKISALFLGVVLPILLFAFSPMWTHLFESTKSLEYESQYIIELSNRITGLEKWENLEIKYENEKLENPHIIGIKFANSGDVSIQRQDFDSQLNVIFDQDVKIIGHKFVEVNPKDIDLVSSVASHMISINPTLLNSGDSFILEVIIDGKNTDFIASARVSGINGLAKKERDSKNGVYLHKVTSTGTGASLYTTLFHLSTFFLLFVAFICFIACSLLDQVPENYDQTTNLVAWAVCMMFGVLTIVFAVLGAEFPYNDSKVFNIVIVLLTWLTLYQISSQACKLVRR